MLDIEAAPILDAPMRRLKDGPLREMLALYQRFGPISCWRDGRARLYFAFGPELNRTILTQTEVFHSIFCPIRGPRGSAQRRLTCGLLNINGETHRRHRKLLSPPFQSRAMSGYMPAILGLARQMLAGWQVGQTRDVLADMNRFLLELTSGLLFGLEERELAYRTGEVLEQFLARNDRVGLAAVHAEESSTAAYHELLQFAEKVETQILELIEWRRRTPGQGRDLLSILLSAHDEQGGITDDELVGHTALLFGAARSTTAYSLVWTMLLAAQHPEVFAQVRQELSSRGVADAYVLEGAELEVLDRVVTESMRILPASAYVQRITTCTTPLGPFRLERGATVVWSQFVSHRVPQIFSEPDRFLPRRWIDFKPPPYSYIPFGMGPRTCLGSNLAMTIIRTVLPMVWSRFTPQLEPGTRIDCRVVATMLSPGGPVPMRLLPPTQQPTRTRVLGDINEYVRWESEEVRK